MEEQATMEEQAMEKLAVMPPRGRGGRKEKYAYDKLFDGHAWAMRRGKDFSCAPKSFGCIVRVAARRRGLSLLVIVQGDNVYIEAKGKGNQGKKG